MTASSPFPVSHFRPGRQASDSLPPAPCRWGGNSQLETSVPSLLARAGLLLAGQSLPRRHGVGGGGTPGLENPGDLRSALSARSGDLCRARVHRGLSLLEVILAVAILGGCLAVTGEMVRMGVRHAEEARELTRAQLLCESKIEEIAAGVTPAESVATVPFETDPDWTYTVDVSSLDQQLTQVRVTVQAVESNRLQPIVFSLSRWILNPASASGDTSTPSTTGGQTTTSGGSSGTSS